MSEGTDIIERLREACVGHPDARVPWPHRVLHDAIDEISRLRADRNSWKEMVERLEAILEVVSADEYHRAVSVLEERKEQSNG